MANIEGERAFMARQRTFLNRAVIDPCSQKRLHRLATGSIVERNTTQAIRSPHQTGPYDSFPAEAFLIRVPPQTSAYIAIRSLEIAWSADVPDRLQQAFGLNAAEAEVAWQFFQLRNMDHIAQQRDVSRLTVRTQIKSIMTNTGSPNNIDLMRLLALVANRALVRQRSQSPVWRDPLEREQHIDLPDGRAVAWTWMRAKDGIPLCFCAVSR